MQVLQICNISRDIITDSETIGMHCAFEGIVFKITSMQSNLFILFAGRCYIPKEYLNDGDLKCLVVDRKPHRIPNAQLKRYAERMLDVADKMANHSIGPYINSLPNQCGRAILAIIEIYTEIGKLIRSNAHYERRTNVPKFRKMCITLKCLYFTALASLDKRSKNKC